MHVKDSETGRSSWVNTASRRVRDSYSAWFRNVSDNETRILNKYRIDTVDIGTDQDFVKRLMVFFSKK